MEVRCWLPSTFLALRKCVEKKRNFWEAASWTPTRFWIWGAPTSWAFQKSWPQESNQVFWWTQKNIAHCHPVVVQPNSDDFLFFSSCWLLTCCFGAILQRVVFSPHSIVGRLNAHQRCCKHPTYQPYFNVRSFSTKCNEIINHQSWRLNNFSYIQGNAYF